MDIPLKIFEWVKKEWKLIKKAPFTYFVCGLLGIVLGIWGANIYFRDHIEELKSQVDGFKTILEVASSEEAFKKIKNLIREIETTKEQLEGAEIKLKKLGDYIKPLRLNDAEKSRLISDLSKSAFLNTTIIIRQGPDTEAHLFADDWASILRESGWQVEPVRLTLANNQMEGVSILTNDVSSEPVKILHRAFMSIGVKPSIMVNSSWQNNKIGLNFGVRKREPL